MGEEGYSEIQEFYRDKSVFLTGGTGFIGQIIIDKLLRCCEVKEIYLLIREKKGKTMHGRMREMLSDPIFERLNSEKPFAAEKLKVIQGDCVLPNLGISDSDRELLLNNVQIVIHGAATVKFDEHLSVAMQINVDGTQFLIELAKNMKHLITFVYVSTAFSNCNRFKIAEKYYEPPISRETVEKYINSTNDDMLEQIQPAILSGFPNTYALTKCLAEQVITQYDKDLPIVVFRPAIVMPTADEPVSGWTNNYYGPVGIVYGVCLGVLHVFYADVKQKAHLVPVDYCVNALLASAWHRESRKETPIYNFVPKRHNMCSWGVVNSILLNVGLKSPPIRTFGHSDFIVTGNKLYANVLQFFYHTLPAMILDAVLIVVGHKFRMKRVYRKIEKLNAVLTYFVFNPFVFEDTQTETLWKSMSEKDKKLFNFDMNHFNWENYLRDSYFGIRKYLLKDDPSTIPAARKRQKKIDAGWRCFLWFLRFLVLAALYWVMKRFFV